MLIFVRNTRIWTWAGTIVSRGRADEESPADRVSEACRESVEPKNGETPRS